MNGQGKSKRHLRHFASQDNLKDALHHAKAGRAEAEDLCNHLARMCDKGRYLLGRFNRLINRLESQVERYGKSK
jgi:hypothetical protein